VKRELTRIVSWGHELLSEVVHDGDLAVDLTAGNGQDTLTLFCMVGKQGRVISFDIQKRALERTAVLLEQAGACVRKKTECLSEGDLVAGVELVSDSHERFSCYVDQAPMGIIANLGYLPGGDRAIITRSESTLAALDQSLTSLAVGGRVAVVVYPGHAGGDVEADAVSGFFSALSDRMFQVLLLKVTNRPQAPFLYVAEKLG